VLSFEEGSPIEVGEAPIIAPVITPPEVSFRLFDLQKKFESRLLVQAINVRALPQSTYGAAVI
jgi:hypothetical protein